MGHAKEKRGKRDELFGGTALVCLSLGFGLFLALNAQSKRSEDRHTMYLEWQTDGHAFLENYLKKDLRARKFYGGPSGVICDPRSGAFANVFECITKCDGPVSFIRCLPPLTN